jgi:hypothetical protein
VPVVTNDPRNPFNRYQASGLRADVRQQAEPPRPEVLEALLSLWEREYGR